MAAETKDWDAATWEGSRRAQLRRVLSLSTRERLIAMEQLTETAAVIASLGAETTQHEAPSAGSRRDYDTAPRNSGGDNSSSSS